MDIDEYVVGKLDLITGLPRKSTFCYNLERGCYQIMVVYLEHQQTNLGSIMIEITKDIFLTILNIPLLKKLLLL